MRKEDELRFKENRRIGSKIHDQHYATATPQATCTWARGIEDSMCAEE